MKNNDLLIMTDIVKKYPGVTALKGVNFRVKRGSVHCLVGENGAGKSTLIKILTCAEKMTAGMIVFDDKPFAGKNVKDAVNAGISTIFQELNIVDQLTVEENLTLGREKHRFGILKKDFDDPVFQLLQDFAPDISIKQRVSSLSLAEKKIIEAVKAIGSDAKLVIMDEPTASLSIVEMQRIYQFVRKLREKGISIIYISHILEDIFTLGDELTVLRDGEIIGSKKVSETTREELVHMMIGKSVHSGYPENRHVVENKLLEARDISTKAIRRISFNLSRGEILGFYGLRGAGKTETAKALFGLDHIHSGKLFLDEKSVSFFSPEQALNNGIAMVPEERLSEGLFMKLSVTDNIAMANLKNYAKFSVVDEKSKRSISEQYVRNLNIKVHSVLQHAATLSGGNQQKVVIAKYLNTNPKILLLDEPTRGIDVGSKEEIYSIIRTLAERGVGIIVFSSEYEEIVSLCDRVVLLAKGNIVDILSHHELDPEKVRHLTMGKGAMENE